MGHPVGSAADLWRRKETIIAEAPEKPNSSRSSQSTSSFAALFGHPLHPLLVPVVIGMYVAATIADIAFDRTSDPFWARSASWLLLGTVVAGLIAALPGIIDLLSIERARRLSISWLHAGGNGLFLMVAAVNYAERQADLQTVSSNQMLLTGTGFVLMAISGWLGGEMTFRHRIGAIEEAQ